MKNSLLRWLRAFDTDECVYVFPREVGLKREMACSFEDFCEYVTDCMKLNIECYSSVFSKWQIENNIFDTIFLDVDDVAFAEIVRGVLEKSNLYAREYCSGRGYHFYIDFPQTKLINYKYAVRRFVSEILDLSDYVDMHVVGDIRRMARVPLTYNSRAGKMMSVISDECFLNRKVAGILESLRMVDSVTAEYEQKIVDVFKSDKLPPCIEKLIEHIVGTGELDHQERLILSTYLLRNFSFEDVKRLMMLCNDYREDKTEYQLRWLIENSYEPYSCRRVKELGVCPLKGRVCEWFPWMGKVV